MENEYKESLEEAVFKIKEKMANIEVGMGLIIVLLFFILISVF